MILLAPDLMGAADVPPIAGRSPSYLVRRLWDMKQGTRNGDLAELMKPALAKLTGDLLPLPRTFPLACRLARPRGPAIYIQRRTDSW